MPASYNDRLSSYEEVLEKDESFSIHPKNIQSRAIEMFQIKHGQFPEIVSDIFTNSTALQFQTKSRFKDTFCEVSLSRF